MKASLPEMTLRRRTGLAQRFGCGCLEVSNDARQAAWQIARDDDEHMNMIRHDHETVDQDFGVMCRDGLQNLLYDSPRIRREDLSVSAFPEMSDPSCGDDRDQERPRPTVGVGRKAYPLALGWVVHRTNVGQWDRKAVIRSPRRWVNKRDQPPKARGIHTRGP